MPRHCHRQGGAGAAHPRHARAHAAAPGRMALTPVLVPGSGPLPSTALTCSRVLLSAARGARQAPRRAR